MVVARGTKCEDHIIIGTPGTLLDWVIRFRAFDPKKCTIFVLDEADVMISQQGHQDQSIRIKKWDLFYLLELSSVSNSDGHFSYYVAMIIITSDCNFDKGIDVQKGHDKGKSNVSFL